MVVKGVSGSVETWKNTKRLALEDSVIVLVYKKGYRKEYTNYQGISLLSLPGKVMPSKCLERICRE